MTRLCVGNGTSYASSLRLSAVTNRVHEDIPLGKQVQATTYLKCGVTILRRCTLNIQSYLINLLGSANMRP